MHGWCGYSSVQGRGDMPRPLCLKLKLPEWPEAAASEG